EPQINKRDLGFVIRKRQNGGMDSSADKTKVDNKDQAIINKLTDFICECGVESARWHGDNFEQFLRKFVKDALELDQPTFEIVRDRKGRLHEFFCTDGATHRIADTIDDENPQTRAPKINGYYPSYVQVYQDQVIAEYYPWELCFAPRNLRSDIRSNGYGTSELEILTNIVTWMLYGDQYNGRQFTQGSAPKGFMIAKGHLTDTRLNEWRQQWATQTAGVNNSHRLPVMSGAGIEDMQWIDLQKSNRDMEFGNWQEYLLKIHCAIYKISPEEIGFSTKAGGGGGSSLFESSKEAQLKYSQDKGLRPLLTFIQKNINKYLIRPEYPDFEFVFVGLDSENEKDEMELDMKRGGSFMTVKELRRKHGLPDEIEEGDFINSSTYLQWLGMQQQQQQQGQEGGEEQDEEDQYDEDEEGGGEESQGPYYTRGGDFVKGAGGNPIMAALIKEFESGYYNK
ncbi:MAG: phage portal protein, partial [Acinetobacter sp.]|nr:phage portal protein [Acinetobacter sp.]